VDALGNPTGFHLTPGQRHDLEGADVLLKDTPGQIVIADKAYDAQTRVVQPLLDKGKEVVIASRSTRKQPREHDRHLYKERHLVENFFARLKQYRAIATRYDKTARNFLGRKGDGAPGAKTRWLGMRDIAVFVQGTRYARDLEAAG
jgi:transposase